VDLGSTEGGAWWDPLTSLISFRGLVPVDDAWLVPIWDPQPRGVLSAALHELTHQWCARTTRLGRRLAHVGAELWTAWEDGSAPQIPDAVAGTLGQLSPLLEGLALYCQLDYAAEDGAPVYSPVAKMADFFTLALDPSLEDVEMQRAVRDVAVADGLLEQLFLHGHRADTYHYFLGYLWLKAHQRLLTARAPSLATGSWFLPLAIKLVADHMAVDGDGDDLVEQVHATVCGLDERWWTPVAAQLGDEDVAEWFDTWWLPHAAYEVDHAALEAWVGGLDERTYSVLAALRAHTMVHLVDWRHGRVHVAGDEVALTRDDGSRDVVRIAPLSNLWRRWWGTEEVPAAELVVSMEREFARRLRRAAGRDVTVGVFATTTRLQFGSALWVDGALEWWVPFSPEPFTGDWSPQTGAPSEAEWITNGLRLDPRRRQRFVAALGRSTAFFAGRRRACAQLEALLSSRPDRARVLVHRLTGRAYQDRYAELARYCDAAPVVAVRLPPTAIAEPASDPIDLPGFPELSTRDVATLLPRVAAE
jgi:hypothetical protein